MSDIQIDSFSLTTPSIVKFIILDLTVIPGFTSDAVYHFSFYSTTEGKGITFGGNYYTPWPIELSGISYANTNSAARPTLTFGNLDSNKLISNLVILYNDIVGANVTLYETFSTYLNSEDEIYLAKYSFRISKKAYHDYSNISFELRDYLDMERAFMPNRIMTRIDFPGLGINTGL